MILANPLIRDLLLKKEISFIAASRMNLSQRFKIKFHARQVEVN